MIKTEKDDVTQPHNEVVYGTPRVALHLANEAESPTLQSHWEKVLMDEGLGAEPEPLILDTSSTLFIDFLEGLRIVDSVSVEEFGSIEEGLLIRQALSSELRKRELEIVILRFYGQWTLNEVAKDFGVTSTRISQIEHRILAKLRRPTSPLSGIALANDEPTEKETKYYHEFIQGRLKLPAELGSEPTVKEISEYAASKEARDLWNKTKAYGDMLCEIFFNNPLSESRSSAYNIVDMISRMVGNLNWFDFDGRSQIALRLASEGCQEDLLEAVRLLGAVNSYSEEYWTFSQEDREEIDKQQRAELDDHLEKLVLLLK